MAYMKLRDWLFAVCLLFASACFNSATAYHGSLGQLGVGSVQCAFVLAHRENPVAQKDIRVWVQGFIEKVNSETSLESKKKTRPIVALDPELLWFATLLYCGLDPNQPLVRATMKMIDAEWDKIEEQNKQKS